MSTLITSCDHINVVRIIKVEATNILSRNIGTDAIFAEVFKIILEAFACRVLVLLLSVLVALQRHLQTSHSLVKNKRLSKNRETHTSSISIF